MEGVEEVYEFLKKCGRIIYLYRTAEGNQVLLAVVPKNGLVGQPNLVGGTALRKKLFLQAIAKYTTGLLLVSVCCLYQRGRLNTGMPGC